MSKSTVLYTYRYMWRVKNAPKGQEARVNFRLVTDTLAGHSAFIERVKQDEAVLDCCREYVCEYDAARVGVVESVVVGEVKA